MRTRAFMQVDVFSETAYRGNPLAVVLDSEGLSDEAMQAFARWTNLSETTFLLPPTRSDCDYRVRIFTPGGELPFAGHPTLGSCHAWLAAGGQPQQAGRVVQECAKGLVPLQQDARSGRLAFAAPSLSRSEITDAELAPVLQAAGLQAGQVLASQKLNNGPVFWALLLDWRAWPLPRHRCSAARYPPVCRRRCWPPWHCRPMTWSPRSGWTMDRAGWVC